jgi:predicted outer membrane repeat protein
VVQNITFVDGNAKDIVDKNNAGGGGAIYAQGGSLKVVNARFFHNVCADLGSDVGGGAIRKLDYLVAPGAGPARPVWIVHSTFGGKTGFGNSCANGGALSSIGVSWNVVNSLLGDNTAVGHGANTGQGGNGGAIYNDGNEIVLDIQGSLLENDKANEGGSAVFFVSNDRTGSITITDSKTQNNPRGTFETPALFGFYVIAKQPATVVNSMILR